MAFSYPSQLPVFQYREEILELLESHQTLIIAGETGSGKTTQIPKICLEFLGSEGGIVGCTQPRRIAATSVAARVREELNDNSALVGYTIRFQDRTTAATKIKFMTDGILLTETKRDPLLKQYSVIIVDEAHERSLNIDFLLGYLKKIIPRRRDLKVIITSATIDTGLFSKQFADAPVLNIEGRSFPVDVQYLPQPEKGDEAELNLVEYCCKKTLQLLGKLPPGDILVFMPTEKDIRQCCDILGKKCKDEVILPMFGRLQARDQANIFRTYHQRKIIVSTNVAETSVTVPGIRYVIDTGLARISQYNPRAKTNSLPVTRISQSSCNQRKGRCGRIGPGTCFRLYSEEDFASRSEYSVPEIRRANLAAVILKMIDLELGRPADFPFIDPPQTNQIRDGERLLLELGGIDRNKRLTEKGRIMAMLPIDPCISRIIIEAEKNRCLKEIKIIASALAIQDPRTRPAEKEKEADAAHLEFVHPHSEFLSLLKIWNSFHDDKGTVLSWSKIKKRCKSSFLSFQRIREWFDLHDQMNRVLQSGKRVFSDNREEASYEQIHRSICAGFLRNIGYKNKKHLYHGSGMKEMMVFPGSSLFGKTGRWIIASTFLETNNLYCLNVANIEPEWIEETGRHLCSYSWSSPRWEKRSGNVVADEQVSLYGLILTAKRKVVFGKLPQQRQEARQIFIEEALVQGQITGSYPFLEKNRSLIANIREMEHRLRKKDIIVDENQIFLFYDKNLPDSVYNRSTLNRFLRSKKQHARLTFREEDISHRKADRSELADFPREFRYGSLSFPIRYTFDPLSEKDGMTIQISYHLAQTLQPERFDWLVPGLLREKTTLLLKSLPKSLRKKLIPINGTRDMLLDEIADQSGIYLDRLESGILKNFGFSIARREWNHELPPYLTPRFELLDERGRIIQEGRNLAELVSTDIGDKAIPDNSDISRSHRQGLEKYSDKTFTDCDFDSLEERYPLLDRKGKICGFLFSCLEINEDEKGVFVSTTKNARRAQEKNDKGMILLYSLAFQNELRSLKKYCRSSLKRPSIGFFFQGAVSSRELVDSLILFVIRSVFSCNSGTIPRKEFFQKTVQEVKKQGFYQLGCTLVDRCFASIRTYTETAQHICRYFKNNEKQQAFFFSLLADILPQDFLATSSSAEIHDSERYMKALRIRVERAYANPAKDNEKEQMYAKVAANLTVIRSMKTRLSPQQAELIEQYKQMAKEYSLALFAPEIKVAMKVSPKRLDTLWSKIHTGRSE